VDQLNKHVAIRLSSTSTEYAQFCQLFKVSACPSVCFISSKGDVLQVVSGVAELTASNLGQVLQVLVLKRTLELRRQAAAKEEEEKQKQAELKRREDAKIVADARKAQEVRAKKKEHLCLPSKSLFPGSKTRCRSVQDA
jgi:hypothetical protein